MSLDARDYLKWYSDEITRYRNHEWQIASYSGAFLAFVAAWFSDESKKQALLALGMPVVRVSVIAFVAFSLIAETYTHKRLGDYRRARDILIKNPDDHPYPRPLSDWSWKHWKRALKEFAPSSMDWFYFLGFFLFILGTGLLAIRAVWAGGIAIQYDLVRPL